MRDYIQPNPTPPPVAPPPRKNPFVSVSIIVNTTLALLVLLYFGILMLSRTDGFASIIKGQLDKRLGLEFKVGHSALTASLGMILQDVKGVVPKDPLNAGVSAKRVVIKWNWLQLLIGGDSPLRELRVEDADLLFALDASGRWQPAPFNEVSTWLARRLQMDLNRYTSMMARASSTNAPAAKTSDELDLFAEQRVEMKNGLVHWQVVPDSEIARAEGVDLASTRVKLPNRDITHFLLHIRTAATAQGTRIEEKRMELLEFGDKELWIDGSPTGSVTRATVVRPPVVLPLEPRRKAATTNAPVAEKKTAVQPLDGTPEISQPPPALPAVHPDLKPEE